MANSVIIPVDIEFNMDKAQLTSISKAIDNALKTKKIKAKDLFEPISNSAKKLSVNIKGLNLGDFFNKFSSSAKKLSSRLFYINNSVKSLSSSFSSLGKIALQAISVASIINVGKKMVKLSSDLIEIQNVVDTVFGDMSDDINDFAQSALKSFGLTELQAKNFASIFGGLLEASDIVGDAQKEMSINLTKLTGDVASFYNMDYNTVFEKLQSGLTGEVKAMRSFGVNMTITNLEAWALANGITKTYNEMNQAEKTALRYNYMLEKLSNAQGDFNKTQGSWANQTRILVSQVKQLGSILGGLLQKVLYPVLTVINQIIGMAISGANALAKMFGFDVESVQVQQGISGAKSGVALGDTGADAMDDLADSTDDATDAQKKLNAEQKKSLANIHDLNVLQSKDTSVYDTDNISSGFDFELSKYKDIYESENPVNSLFNDLEDAVKNNDWRGIGSLLSSKLNSILYNIDLSKYIPDVESGANALADILNGFIESLSFDKIGSIVGDGINLVIISLNRFFEEFDFYSLGKKISDNLNSLFNTVDFYELGKFVLNKFNALFQILVGAVTEFDWKNLGSKIADGINSIFDNFDFDSLIVSIYGLVNGLFELIISAMEDINWGSLASNLSYGFVSFAKSLAVLIKNIDWIQFSANLYNGIKAVLLNIDWLGLVGAIGELIFNAVGGIGASLVTIVVGIIQDIVKVLWSISGFISDIYRYIISSVNEFIGNIIGIVIFKLYSLGTDIANWFTDFISSICEWLSSVGSSISSWFSNTWGSITSFLGSIISYITGSFSSAWYNAWSGIRDVFNTLFDNIGGIFNGVINTVISAVNTIIRAINSISWDVPDWVPGIGGSTFGFSIPEIPKLAQGAVIPPNQEFIALLGDQRSGVNIETPLDTMLQAFRGALAEFSDYNIGDIVIPIYIDNELSSEQIIRKQDIERYRSNGK